MKKTIPVVCFCFFAVLTLTHVAVFAQRATYDLLIYAPPKGWKKEVKENTYTSYTSTNIQKKSYCQIFIMFSTGSMGSIKKDFENEWKTLVANPYNVSDTPHVTQATTEDGLEAKGGTALFTFNNGNSIAMLTTISGYNKAVSIVAVTNSQDYIPAIQALLKSVKMKKPEVFKQDKTIIPPVKGNFVFTTTNFDDGWTSTVQEDWVQVAKGTTRVLIHYPNKNADAYNPVLLDGLKNAWNVLVAPKYSAARNFEFKPVGSWESIEFAEADAIEKRTGKAVHVVLFKKNYSNGSGKYVEFITSDKRSFEQQFGAYHESSSGWEKMENMAGYNKFAIAAADLKGKWTSDFSSAIQYVNASTGFDAHMDTHAAVENFQFVSNNEYKWDLAVASGGVGNIKFQSVKSNGKFSVVGNWQLNFSDIEGKAKTYNAFFSCIKGLRVLWLDNKAFGKVE